MTGPIPTKPNDVLILHTLKAATRHAVGPVTQQAEQDLQHAPHVDYVSDRSAAEARARELAARSGGRIFVVNTDTEEWEQLHG